ncbi:gamma-glutamyl-gamma-aminobutyrate hydrolase family protein [Gulosibacter macacae]|uniref:Gamma-glutamyl-gamma-aminobutyrate hydrolase family protein n=1 Tax=Gulosibacter macacae TaxID=2488791 RepID=A0A3P3W1Q3_9MICO|nr:gamma-glutamyl-gamma-aminobutyrate hydrolase family protein [Gulosibacter macacae]RRJ87619.1 gamma-glutamyl-gamma-aminobutyrate hydrolase family protein [Gulosibacter macacae]
MADGQYVIHLSDVLPEPPETPGDVEVAVVGQLNLPDQGAETYELLLRFTKVALQAIQDAGARIRFIDVTDDAEPDYAAIQAADAIVVLGGGDVESSLYGHHDEVPNEYGVDPRSDERQIRVIREAIDQDAALVAICRGSQLLNVASGGTLIPDLVPSELHRGSGGDPIFKDEEINLVADSIIGRIFEGREQLVVRSGHHQAVGEVAPSLRVTAVAHDGIVEGTQHTDREWVWGVQWHPEDSDGSADDRRVFFAAVVAEARRRAARR